MEKLWANFRVANQVLTRTSPLIELSSDTIGYCYAHFDLTDEWKNFDVVRAIWQNDQLRIGILLDENWECKVPMEVLSRETDIVVYLVGSNIDDTSQLPVQRLTTFPEIAYRCRKKVMVECDDEGEVSPSIFEQYVARVQGKIRQVTDMTVEAHESEEVEVIKTIRDVVNLDFGIPVGDDMDPITNSEIEALITY